MKSLAFLIFVGLAGAEVYERCNWARVLKNHGMDNYQGYSLANWVCLTNWESHYDTEAINHNTDGSTDYGIFQINSRWWCDDGSPHLAIGCNIRCSALLTNDVSVAITCAKRVVRDPNGMSAWVAWRKNCKDRDLSSYLSGCDV